MKKKQWLRVLCSFILMFSLLALLHAGETQAAVTLQSSTIRDYVLAKVGKNYANGQCLRFVEECYQNLGGSRPYNCCASKSGNSYIKSTNFNNIPIGATVYFGNCGGGPCRRCGSSYYGHVGIYVGDGYFVHATGGKVKKSTMSSWRNKYRGYGYCGNFTLSTSTSYNPQGMLDNAEGGENKIRVYGWAFDADDYGKQLDIHVYIGKSSASKKFVSVIKANKSRPDVGRAYPGAGNYHGYEEWITVDVSGRQTVYVYAINVGGGENVLLGTKTVNVSSDTTAPVIKNVKITNVTSRGYTVSCTVTDNKGVERVQFPTWTEKNGQDDIQKNWDTNSAASGQKSGNTYTYYVSVSDHNNETGKYITHIYAYDKSGNRSACAAPAVIIKAKAVYYGDLDMNGEITVTDLSGVMQAVVGTITLNDEQKKRADVNGDGKIDSLDVSLINQYIVKLIEKFPVEG